MSAWTRTLSDAERREIVQLLVRRITVHTTLPGRGRKQVRVVIDYRFPRVGEARTGIAASSQLQSLAALSPPEPESPRHRPHPVPTAAAGLSRFQFPQHHRCGEDIPKARVTLRSVAPTLPFE